MAQLLTGLPEAEVLGWGSRHQVRPTTRAAGHLRSGLEQAARWGLLTTELFPKKVHEVGPSHGVFQELPEAEGPLLHAQPGGRSCAGGGRAGQKREEWGGPACTPGPPAHLGAFMAQ